MELIKRKKNLFRNTKKKNKTYAHAHAYNNYTHLSGIIKSKFYKQMIGPRLSWNTEEEEEKKMNRTKHVSNECYILSK